MDPLSYATFTFGLRVIHELGFNCSLVFSPILLLLSAIEDKNAMRKFKINKKDVSEIPKLENLDFVTEEEGNMRNTLFTATWRYRYVRGHRATMKFNTTSGNRLQLKFVHSNSTLSEKMISENVGFRVAEDRIFQVLEIPLMAESLRYVIFLPVKIYTLEQSLRKLDANRIKTLFDDLTVRNINFTLPCFSMSSKIDTGQLFEQKTSKFHKFQFSGKRPLENYSGGSDEIFSGSFVKRTPDRTIYSFKANRPFFYAIFKNDTLPLLMGTFIGSN